MDTDSLGKGLLTLGVVGTIALLFAQGCTPGDVIQVDVPPEVRKVVNSEPRVSYNDSLILFEDYTQASVKGAERFQANIDEKAEWVSLLASITNDALATGIPILENMPGGGLLVTAAIGIGGLITRRPGDAKREADREAEFLRLLTSEKEASFNEGQKKAIELAAAKGGAA